MQVANSPWASLHFQVSRVFGRVDLKYQKGKGHTGRRIWYLMKGMNGRKDREYKTIENSSPSRLALYDILESRALYQLLPFTDGIPKHF